MVGTTKKPAFGRVCQAKYCTSTAKQRKTHKFPTNPTLRKIWLEYADCGNHNLHSNEFLCSRHFKQSDYRRKQHGKKQLRLLKVDAVPTVPLFEAASSKARDFDKELNNLDGSDNGNGEMEEEYTFNGGVLLRMYDPQNDQLGLLDKIDEQPLDELQTPYDDSEELSSVSEYSVRIKQEDELIVDEDDDMNGYETKIYEGEEFFEHVSEEYGETEITVQKSEMEAAEDDNMQLDDDETELLKENSIDPEIDPGSTMNGDGKRLLDDAAQEEEIDVESIDVDPAVLHHTPLRPTRSPTKTTPKSPIKATKTTENSKKEPLTPAHIEKMVENAPKITNNLLPSVKVTKSKEDDKDKRKDIPVKPTKSRPSEEKSPGVEEQEELEEEEEMTRRITRNTEILETPKTPTVAKAAEKEKNHEKSLDKPIKSAKPKEPLTETFNGFDLPTCIIPLKKLVVTPKEKAAHEQRQTSVTSPTKPPSLPPQKSRVPLNNSTPIIKVASTAPPKKRKHKDSVLYLNPMCLVNHKPVTSVQQPAPKRPRIVVPPAIAAKSSSLVRHRQNTSNSRRVIHAPPLPTPPFRIRDPVLIEKELENLQSHYKRLKDENSRIHQENARLFLVNSRLQSENSRLRASAILTNSKLKLENEKLRAANELYKGERIREQNEAQLALEETEMLKDELEEARKDGDELREQLQTALTTANNAMIAAAAAAEAAENESTTTEAASAKKKPGTKGTPNETLVLANKVYKLSGSKVYETLRPILKFPSLRTLLIHKKKNEALFATTDDEDDAD